MGHRSATAACFLLGVAALAGCGAEMSEQACRTANWYKRGIDDGLRGEPRRALDTYTRACADYKITPDRNAWW